MKPNGYTLFWPITYVAGGINMEEYKTYQELTDEERNKINKLLSATKYKMLFAGMKSILGLVIANLISIIVGRAIMVDASPNFVIGYQVICVLINGFFLGKYFNKQIIQIDDILKEQIKEILKKHL